MAFAAEAAESDISCPSGEAITDGNETRASHERERDAGPATDGNKVRAATDGNDLRAHTNGNEMRASHERERDAGLQRTGTWLGGADERERERAGAHLPCQRVPASG